MTDVIECHGLDKHGALYAALKQNGPWSDAAIGEGLAAALQPKDAKP